MKTFRYVYNYMIILIEAKTKAEADKEYHRIVFGEE